MKIFEKQPTEVLDFFFDFRTWLGSKQDTPASYVVEAAPGITLSSHNMNTPGVVQVFMAGGTTGQKYKVTCRLSTAGARVKESEFTVKVKDA
jgi:hypothetical protein